ncbi:MAG: FAD-dependent oxidoreductase, partial [Haloglomus sp.]
MADPTRVAVIGAGIMGSGLATHLALEGCDVTLIDHRQSNLDDATDRIRDAVAFLRDEADVTATRAEVVDAIEMTLDQDEGVADPEIVLETVSEDLS